MQPMIDYWEVGRATLDAATRGADMQERDPQHERRKKGTREKHRHNRETSKKANEHMQVRKQTEKRKTTVKSKKRRGNSQGGKEESTRKEG